MLYIIGRSNCKSCSEVKVALQNNNIKFIYLDFDKDIEQEAKREYAKMIREENNGYLPLIINNGIVIHEDELYAYIKERNYKRERD